MTDCKTTALYDARNRGGYRVVPVLAVLVMLVSGCATPRQAEKEHGPFFFIQMADPQIPWGPG